MGMTYHPIILVRIREAVINLEGALEDYKLHPDTRRRIFLNAADQLLLHLKSELKSSGEGKHADRLEGELRRLRKRYPRSPIFKKTSVMKVHFIAEPRPISATRRRR